MTDFLKSSNPASALMKDWEVAELLSLSRRQVWKLSSAGKLPAPVRLAGSTRWRRGEIEAIIETLPTAK
ncbi:MAG TPA: helix-turn-helix domain-containing protein [Phycisphaerae bacterium]|nr:helix-turn-helix domain-containing protein [Phycisphaerae bacterium]